MSEDTTIEVNTTLEAAPAESAAKPAKAKKEKVAKPEVVRDQQNGVTRPAAGTKTGRVWEIADAESDRLGSPSPRKNVMDIGKAEGINEATIATQYSRWRSYNGLVGVVLTAAAPVAAEGEEKPKGKGKSKKA